MTAAYKAWDAAFNSGDAKAIAASYTADAELLPPTHTIANGPAEIEKFFDGLLKGGVKSHALKLVEAGGTDKTVYGTANWSATNKDGKPIGGLATWCRRLPSRARLDCRDEPTADWIARQITGAFPWESRNIAPSSR